MSAGIHRGHVNIEVTNLVKARRFYDGFLPVLGFKRVAPEDLFWLGYRKGRTTVWITASHPKRVARTTPHVPTDGLEDPISDHWGSVPPRQRGFRISRRRSVVGGSSLCTRPRNRGLMARLGTRPTLGAIQMTTSSRFTPSRNVRKGSGRALHRLSSGLL